MSFLYQTGVTMGTRTYHSFYGKKYTIDDSAEIQRGGEGRILSIKSHPDLAAKIYHPGIIPISQEQFDYISTLEPSLFIVPLDLLYDKNNRIIGFVMEYLGNNYFPLSTIFSKNFCARDSITGQTKREIAKSLINAIKYAHNNQLIIGDLNQYNILINKQGNIKLIDVDSYETPNHKHSGILLEEIRDYLHGGIVTQNSDFFALSVLLFYSFTYTHPFKGIHAKYKNLAERMIHKLPVFINDPDLKPPKCYQPVQDDILKQQFSKLYLAGERFLISLQDVKDTISRKPKPIVVTEIVQKKLSIKPVLQNIEIINISFSNASGYIETNNDFFVYSTKNKGYVTKEHTISKKYYTRLFPGLRNIVLQKDNSLYHYKSNTEITKIENFSIRSDSIICRFDNILIVIEQDVMHWLYLDEIINKSIRNERIEVFGKSFRMYTGLMQNTGGVNRIFYNTGKNLANIKINVAIKDLYQQLNIGIIQCVESNEIVHKYFKIKGLSFELSNIYATRLVDFAYMPVQKGEGFVFQPADNQINVLRTPDFQQISVMDCDFISEQTKLQYTKSGIIAWEGKAVYLLNKN